MIASLANDCCDGHPELCNPARDAHRSWTRGDRGTDWPPNPCVLIDCYQAGLKRQVLSSAETGPPFKFGMLGVVRVGGAVRAGDTVLFGARFAPGDV